MNLRVAAIDDEPPALELIRQYVARIPELKLVEVFTDALSAAEFLRQSPVDLLFLDIQMPDISGIELARSMKNRPMIIFTTAHKQFAVEGFNLDAVDYLLKPFSFERFSRAVQKAMEYHQYRSKAPSEPGNALFVYSEYRMIKIDWSEIEYIESMEDYIRIHLTNQKPVMTLMTLKAVLEKLPSDRFRRIHRSFVVAVPKVRSVLNKKVKLASGVELPVSESHASFIKEWKNS